MQLKTVVAALVFAMPALALAECKVNEPDSLSIYDGTIGEKYRVRMTLILAGGKVTGQYFYASQLRDIAVQGTVTRGQDIVLDELDGQGRPTARFEATFPERDPKGGYGGSPLACEVIVGSWSKVGSSEKLPVYLSMTHGTHGTLNGRYALIDGDDELIHRRALAFQQAVRRGDKKAVAALLTYPMRVNSASGRKRVRSPAEFVARYDAIFSSSYRDAILRAIPRAMFVRDQGVMLGDGEVWFGPDGKVTTLNSP